MANAATTVDAICEKAELTKGSFYYFLIRKRIWVWRFWIGLFGEARRCWQVDLTPELWILLKRLLPSSIGEPEQDIGNAAAFERLGAGAVRASKAVSRGMPR